MPRINKNPRSAKALECKENRMRVTGLSSAVKAHLSNADKSPLTDQFPILLTCDHCHLLNCVGRIQSPYVRGQDYY